MIAIAGLVTTLAVLIVPSLISNRSERKTWLRDQRVAVYADALACIEVAYQLVEAVTQQAKTDGPDSRTRRRLVGSPRRRPARTRPRAGGTRPPSASIRPATPQHRPSGPGPRPMDLCGPRLCLRHRALGLRRCDRSAALCERIAPFIR